MKEAEENHFINIILICGDMFLPLDGISAPLRFLIRWSAPSLSHQHSNEAQIICEEL